MPSVDRGALPRAARALDLAVAYASTHAGIKLCGQLLRKGRCRVAKGALLLTRRRAYGLISVRGQRKGPQGRGQATW